jgi:hypothetical protein
VPLAQEELATRRDALRARRGRLKAARELAEVNRASLTQQNAELLEDEFVLLLLITLLLQSDDECSTRSACASIRLSSHSRRTQLITLLSHIFPIDPVSPSSPTPAHHLLFSIVSLPLPNSSYPPLFADETLSSALGYTAQVVSTLAAYLGVPLHYPIKCLGSRSAVVDMISMMRGPRAFPLYGRGVDRYRFDYGVFLLNKNIEQVL